ncbi:MAG: ABC transporter ATP-binding protein, partial [Proteobacteria bacterium]|nr:ABC transporter ATP-binding protein [Pseudomonadota bacterium]
IILLSLPFLAWISRYFQNRILTSAREVRQTNSRITGAYNENIMGVLTSKVFVKEADNLQKFGRLTDRMHQASITNAVQAAIYLPLVLTLSALTTGIALVVGGIEAAWGLISTGTLIAFLTYTRHFFEPIEQLAHWFAEMQMAQASAERVVSLIQAEPEIKDSDEVIARLQTPSDPALAEDGYESTIETLTLKDVGFRYKTGDPVLEAVNLTITSGESVAIVGATGGGKTTLASLIARFYEPTSGQILINGIDYRERGLAFLQSNLGVVLQSSHLFAGTIFDNIRYGKLSAEREQVIQAARQAGAHEVIEGMSAGYETRIGEGGSSLSAGQKQLISFARALLADPQILIMDEATSSVDTITEARIEKGLRALLKDRLSVIIAHRLSTIRHASKILVIDRGRIIEQGNHDQLISLRGRYHHLYQQQSLSNLWQQPSGSLS